MFKKILIPTDGSPLSSMAALEGVDLARRIGAEIVGIYVARENQNPAFDFSDIRPKHYPSQQEYKDAIMQAGEAFLKPVQEAAEKAGIKFTRLIAISNATARQIVKSAHENECDLIYMGSHGCAGWGNVLLGSVATKVLSTSLIPVLVYKFKREQVPQKAMREHLDVIPGV